MIYSASILVFYNVFCVCTGEVADQNLRGQSAAIVDDTHVLVSGENVQTLSDYDKCSQNLLNVNLTPLNAYIWYLRCIGDVFRGKQATVPSAVPSGTSGSTQSPTNPPPPIVTTLAPIVKATSSDIFLWLEWPGAAQGAPYYDNVISFVESNSANYRVTKIIARVNDPNFEPNLWQIGTNSIFYINFLSRLPSSVDVRVLPYLLDPVSSASWVSSMGAPSSLEAVYKFASAWNALLSQTAGYSGPLLGGIVVDSEEKQGFSSFVSSIPSFQSKYSTPGQALLKFGWTTGYDTTGGIPQMPGYIDEVYVEMYDFYIHGVYPAVVIEANGPGLTDNPSNYLSLLDNEVWGSMIASFSSSSKIQFMWSLQHTGSDCLYPMGSYGCGANNDLGSWSPGVASEFLTMVANKYSVFGTQPKGFFQFSFLPSSWM